MRWIQALLRSLQPRNDYFFELLRQVATLLDTETKEVQKYFSLPIPEREAARRQAKQTEGQIDRLVGEVRTKLNATFVTPIDRGDIDHVATELKRLAHRIYDSAENASLYAMKQPPEFCAQFCDELASSTSKIRELVEMLGNSDGRDKSDALALEVVELERQGDRFRRAATREMTQGLADSSPITVEILRKLALLESFEIALDDARHTAELISRVLTRAI